MHDGGRPEGVATAGAVHLDRNIASGDAVAVQGREGNVNRDDAPGDGTGGWQRADTVGRNGLLRGMVGAHNR